MVDRVFFSIENKNQICKKFCDTRLNKSSRYSKVKSVPDKFSRKNYIMFKTLVILSIFLGKMKFHWTVKESNKILNLIQPQKNRK